jgi:L-lactate dehydrogenase (cytochrome)
MKSTVKIDDVNADTPARDMLFDEAVSLDTSRAIALAPTGHELTPSQNGTAPDNGPQDSIGNRDMKSVLTIAEMKERARRRVPKMFFDYADSGAWTESTYRANEDDYAKIKLRQRVLVDMTGRSLETTMIGQKVAMPVALSPTGLTGMQHADGEMLAAQAAEEFGVPFTLSTMSICSIEDVASVTKKPFWFQLYVMKDREFVENLINRAKAAKCSALVLTLDLQILGQRHKDIRNGLSAPPKFTPKHIWQMATRPFWCLEMLQTQRRTFRNIAGHAKDATNLSSLATWTHEQFDPQLSWKDVAWIKEKWGGPLILKGILDTEDARAAADTGADAIIVSNHGGRQLDGAHSSISMLPKIVEAVGDKIEVHVDGGIRSGQDVLKAVALGAKGTYIGRPFLYGLGAGGKAGVTRVLEIIQREMDITMALCGKRNISEINRDILAD